MLELWRLLADRVFVADSTGDLFNPYARVDPELDQPGADRIRQENLKRYVESYPSAPPVLVVGEAPGPRGCRFSGVPFTNEAQLLSGALPFSGKQSSNRPEPYSAYSSNFLWPEMLPYFPRFLLWNAVPLHPHMPGRPLSIRTPRRREVKEWSTLLRQMVDILDPRLVVALGRKAEVALGMVGVDCVYLRHPSQGGLKEFREGVHRLLRQSESSTGRHPSE